MKKLITLTLIFLISVSATAQIVTGKVVEKPVNKTNDTTARRVPTEGLNEFSFYLGLGYNFSRPLLKEAAAPYGEPLGERANETGLNIMSYQFGVRNRVSQYMSYDAGISIDRYGEKYSYNHPTSDSTFKYTNTYTAISLPVQVFFTTGKDFRLFVGGGIQPSLATSYKYAVNGTDSVGTSFTSERKSIEEMNGFSMALIASGGFQWRWSDNVSIYCIPTYVIGITSDYKKQSAYDHYMRGFNLKFGLTIHLPENK